MSTPHLTRAISAIERAIDEVEAADLDGEAPQPTLGMCLLQLRNLRRILQFHEWRPR